MAENNVVNWRLDHLASRDELERVEKELAELRSAIEKPYRLMAIEREQNNCMINRARVMSAVAQHGLHGIAVKDDPIAKHWQALEVERCRIEQEIRNAMNGGE